MKKFTPVFAVTIPIALAATLLAVVFLLAPSGHSQAASAGWAIQFDGTSDLIVFTQTSRMLGSGWEMTKTVSLWVKPTGPAFCGNNDIAWCDHIFGDRPRWWGISIGDLSGGSDPTKNRIWVWNRDDNGLDRVGIEYTVGEWVNITLVHEAGLLYAYKNGIEVGHVASGVTAQPDTGAQPVLQLGGVIVSTDRNWTFEGQIDEVQLWNRALTSSEINQYIFQPLTGNEPGLRAYYRMSDGPDSTILTDDSPFDWTGELGDGTTAVPGDGTLPLWVLSDLEPTPPPKIPVYLPMLIKSPK